MVRQLGYRGSLEYQIVPSLVQFQKSPPSNSLFRETCLNRHVLDSPRSIHRTQSVFGVDYCHAKNRVSDPSANPCQFAHSLKRLSVWYHYERPWLQLAYAVSQSRRFN